MAIHSKHLETLEAVIAPALNIVKNRPLVDLYVHRHYTGEFRIRVQPGSGRRYVITIKEERGLHPLPGALPLAPQERNASHKTTAARMISSAAIVVTSAEVPGY